MTRAATARSTRKRFIEASTGGAKSDRVAGVLSQREVPRKDPAAPRLFRPRGPRLHLPLVQAEHLHGLVEPRAELGESLRAAGLFQDFFVTVRVGDSPWHD